MCSTLSETPMSDPKTDSEVVYKARLKAFFWPSWSWNLCLDNHTIYFNDICVQLKIKSFLSGEPGRILQPNEREHNTDILI